MTTWHRRFILLALINGVLIVTLFVFLLLTPPVSDALPDPTYQEELGAKFTVETTKSDLNDLINTYINQVLKTNQANFDVIVDNDIQLNGELYAFGVPIPLRVTMDPVVMDNGDIVLKMNTLSLGLLDLPRGRILHYINRQVETPDWLYFDSENEQIYLAVTSIEIDSNLRFRVDALDLSTDSIIFTFTVPKSGVDTTTNE
ncbi:YpmS family protein [Halolactibacillus miurensis]|nr:YpmS family protein [Halolactibacillus miurensis]